MLNVEPHYEQKTVASSQDLNEILIVDDNLKTHKRHLCHPLLTQLKQTNQQPYHPLSSITYR